MGCGNDCPQAFKNVKIDYQLDWDCFGGKTDIRWNKNPMTTTIKGVSYYVFPVTFFNIWDVLLNEGSLINRR